MPRGTLPTFNNQFLIKLKKIFYEKLKKRKNRGFLGLAGRVKRPIESFLATGP